MTSAISFQGLSSGLQTDALVSAILAQEGKTLSGLQARQARNKTRTTALTSMKTSMSNLSISLAALQDKLNARTVTSSDSNNTNVTATASGAVSGSYEVKVTTLATKGQLTPVQGSTLSVADPAAAIFSSSSASFAVQGTDGVTKAFSLTNNSLNGLRDAINASGAGVTATIVNSGSGTNPYQLVVTAKATGTGSTSGIVKLAAIPTGASATTLISSPGVTLGNLSGGITGSDFSAPGEITNGLSSTTAATNAVFSVNGIQLTRTTNVVSDAADGITFTLKQGAQSGTTTLTVTQDKTTATAGMQDVITKYNALLGIYKAASASTKNDDGSVNQGPLAGDSTTRTIMSQIRSALTGTSSGLPSSSTYQTLAGLGVKTAVDGTLSLDTTTFQAAIEKDPAAVRRLFIFAGDSTNGAVSVSSGSSTTATGSVDFTIDSYTSGGTVSGLFSGTYNGTAFTNVRLTGSNGTLVGAAGTALEGLTLAVTAAGSGTLTLSRGAGQASRDLIASLSASGTGSIATALTNITTQNTMLLTQIDSATSALARRKKVLEAQFSKMETTIGQLKAAGGSLTTL